MSVLLISFAVPGPLRSGLARPVGNLALHLEAAALVCTMQSNWCRTRTVVFPHIEFLGPEEQNCHSPLVSWHRAVSLSSLGSIPFPQGGDVAAPPRIFMWKQQLKVPVDKAPKNPSGTRFPPVPEVIFPLEGTDYIF